MTVAEKRTEQDAPLCPCGAPRVGFRFGYFKMCQDCLDREIAAEKRVQAEKKKMQQERQERERADAWRRLCPPLYQRTDPERLPAEQLNAVMAWQYGPRGLLLTGPTGTGKTRAAWLLLKRLYFKERREIIALDAVGFSHDCIDAFSGKIDERESGGAWARRLARVPVLFLDDFGKSPMSERVEAELFGIVERRMAHELPIIVTTNAVGDEFIKMCSKDRGAPLVRRLRECCDSVVFKSMPK